jgi:diguanylate cyclase (GGDEF)-like protein
VGVNKPGVSIPESDVPLRVREYQTKLTRLQRREWWTWGASLTIMFCLTGGVASLALPALNDKNVFQSVVGLMCLIVLFGVYLTYEKFLINRLRLELAENQSNSAVWRDLALVDPLTGLFNRRYAEKRLREEISRSQRKGYPLTLVLFDLNDFKQINDQFGHPAGDEVLRAFSGALNRAVREADLAARLGGDEFVMLLTECDAAQAEAIVGRISPGEINVNGQQVPIRFAAGWKQYQRGDQAQDMLNAADKALYQDKQRSKSETLAPVK